MAHLFHVELDKVVFLLYFVFPVLILTVGLITEISVIEELT